ncbi:MAG: TlpA disulfide reductase family protein [Balneolaceae bacterium]
MPKLTNLLFLITFFILFASACTSGNSESSGDPELKKAPDFEVTTISGEEVSLQKSIEENKPLVVYFTASWCPTCAQNWPVLSKLYPEYEDRLNLVAVGIDPTDDEAVMRKLSEEKGFTFPVTKGMPEIMLDFGVEAQATTVGVNRDGTIAFQKNNTALSEEEYRALFDELVE